MSRRPALEIGGEGSRTLALAAPVMPAAGFLGHGRAYPGIVDPRVFGALVTAPVTLGPRRPEAGAGFARGRGGFILPMPGPNPGIAAVLREFAPSWRRWQVPVVVALCAADGHEAAAAARRLEQEESVSAIELQALPEAGAEWLRQVLASLRGACDLPVLVRPALHEAAALAAAGALEGAAAIVLGLPHFGAAADGTTGPLYGPATLPYTLAAVRRLRGAVEVPLIAGGGIYCREDAGACLEAGAAAVQLDGLLYLDPAAAAELARSFA